jgi:HEAT repeat protein
LDIEDVKDEALCYDTLKLAIPALIQALQDGEWFVRLDAASALLRIDPNNGASLRVLHLLSKHESAVVRERARLELEIAG